MKHLKPRRAMLEIIRSILSSCDAVSFEAEDSFTFHVSYDINGLTFDLTGIWYDGNRWVIYPEGQNAMSTLWNPTEATIWASSIAGLVNTRSRRPNPMVA